MLRRNASRSVSAYRSLTYAENMSKTRPQILVACSRPELYFIGNRSYIPTPSHVSFNQQWLKTQLLLMPEASSLSFTKVEGKHIVMQDPGVLEQIETDVDLSIVVKIDGLVEDVVARIDGDQLLVQGRTADGVTTYLAGMDLPMNCDKKRGLKWLIKGGGRLLVTLYTLKYRLLIFTNLLSTSLRTTNQIWKLEDLDAFSDALFDRTYLQQNIFPLIACPNAGCRSFTCYKKTAECLYVKMSSGELEQIESTGESLCVSLKMTGFKTQKFKTSFENNTIFVIEGKAETEHYLACFHIPEGYETENGMIKEEIYKGVYKATLPSKHKEETTGN